MLEGLRVECEGIFWVVFGGVAGPDVLSRGSKDIALLAHGSFVCQNMIDGR